MLAGERAAQFQCCIENLTDHRLDLGPTAQDQRLVKKNVGVQIAITCMAKNHDGQTKLGTDGLNAKDRLGNGAARTECPRPAYWGLCAEGKL